MQIKTFNDLKRNDKIKIENQHYLIKKIEFSGKGKHGKSKCRLELQKIDSKETAIIIRPSEETVELL